MRELREETNIAVVDDLTLIGRFHPLPALTAQETRVYLAHLTERQLHSSAAEMRIEEIVGFRIVREEELWAMASNGDITDGITLTSLAFLSVATKRLVM